ncbi:MAG: hypothetical protein LBT54_07075 [Bifidobacteriaceae bacterium]|jgi:hypothetical protein|nr:hypothetical protein [Bifidobacteriaceae bacterium]
MSEIDPMGDNLTATSGGVTGGSLGALAAGTGTTGAGLAATGFSTGLWWILAVALVVVVAGTVFLKLAWSRRRA